MARQAPAPADHWVRCSRGGCGAEAPSVKALVHQPWCRWHANGGVMPQWKVQVVNMYVVTRQAWTEEEAVVEAKGHVLEPGVLEQWVLRVERLDFPTQGAC